MGVEARGGTGSCFRCGHQFGFGELRYRVDVRVAQDTGGEIDEPVDYEGEIAEALDLAQLKTDEELERDVHIDFLFYLCPACKDEYLKGPDVPLDEFFFGT